MNLWRGGGGEGGRGGGGGRELGRENDKEGGEVATLGILTALLSGVVCIMSHSEVEFCYQLHI